MMARLLHAEWTKFRTVRSWVIGALIVVLATVGVGLLAHQSCSINGSACTLPLGPGGEAVSDTFYFVRQPLPGNGTITVRVTSLTGFYSPGGNQVQAGQGGQQDVKAGLQEWSKAGIIIKANTTQGSAYAAMMVTGGHGTRMQDDFVNDIPGLAGRVSAASPRWLRLTRDGDTVTGYDSADGTHWTRVGTATLPGLPAITQIGLFATSPADNVVTTSLASQTVTGGPTEAAATMDHVELTGSASGWTGDQVGGGPGDMNAGLPGSYRQAGGVFTVTGSGDIAPDVPGIGAGDSIGLTLIGTFAGLIVAIIVATMFITAEYRRGLILTTFTASPRRIRALAAKATVIGVVTFTAGLAAAAIALPLGTATMRGAGVFVDPVPALTVVRLVVGTAALLAVSAVLALAIAAMVRRSAIAVTLGVVLVAGPYILAALLSSPATQWLLRLTPAAGFAIQQAYPRYPQVTTAYSVADGYYPLSPWAGFAVLCAWAVAALALAAFLLLRRDA
jgi:ABC-type transport system involved in multi-copper enzyme maturation permease subunit/regulation of enolase protein 1 (concanavalin A-like superfamily)